MRRAAIGRKLCRVVARYANKVKETLICCIVTDWEVAMRCVLVTTTATGEGSHGLGKQSFLGFLDWARCGCITK
jgi:hypothetical protein